MVFCIFGSITFKTIFVANLKLYGKFQKSVTKYLEFDK